jgi:two-component system, cell cycle sensor histidine kinase and response regulator CckA
MSDTQLMGTVLFAQKLNHETILIVEDDEPLLKLLRYFLDDAGYNVMSAKNGEEAVDTYKKYREQIDLVVTDLGLPGLTGKDEIATLGRINPNVRIICASGYVAPSVKNELFRAGAKAIVSKPYAPQEILQKVRTVLDSRT